MKWKDSGNIPPQGENQNPPEEYFDEEHYSPWAAKEAKSAGGFRRIPIVFILLGLAIVMSVAALLMLLLGSNGAGGDAHQQVTALEERVRQLEERLDKYEAIDEKVTRIWEQAKSFEKFKDRFDRSEASTLLRMDHLTMNLEALQKQLNEPRKASVATPTEIKPVKQAALESPGKLKYHMVAAGDTFYSISKRYNLSIENLLRMNHMDADSILQPGQKIIVHNVEGN